MRKNIWKGLLVVLFAFTFIEPVLVEHKHDDKCGYNPETETGCIYEYDIMLLGNNKNYGD